MPRPALAYSGHPRKPAAAAAAAAAESALAGKICYARITLLQMSRW